MDYFDIRPQSFYLFSHKSRRFFKFSSLDHSLEHAVEDAFSKIKRLEGGNVYAMYQFESKTLDVMTELSNKYKLQYPNIQSLPSFCRELSEGDLFIRQQSWVPLFDLKRSIIKIDAIAANLDYRTEDNIFVMNYGKLYLSFDTYSFGFLNEKIKIGEKDLDKRVCRFCGRTGAKHFQDESHAIQIALGNRLLICNEECDHCNHEFSESVEKHLYKFLEINRTLYKVSGRSTRNHHLEGENFHIHPDSKTQKPIVYVMQELIINDLYQGKPTGRINLYNKGKISYQGIYKALLKIAIDMIPLDRIHHFVQAGRWVHGDFDYDSLPCFSYGEHNTFFEQPTIDLFFRKGTSFSENTPYCTAVLHIFNGVFIYTIPFNDMDNDKFMVSAEIEHHLNMFKQSEYLYVQEWVDYDSNDTTLMTPFYKMSLFSEDYEIVFKPSTDSVFQIERH